MKAITRVHTLAYTSDGGWRLSRAPFWERKVGRARMRMLTRPKKSPV